MVPRTKQKSHLINKIILGPDLMNDKNQLNPTVHLERQQTDMVHVVSLNKWFYYLLVKLFAL